MKNAKYYLLLSNGIHVTEGDKVEVLTNEDERYVGYVMDVSEYGICCDLIDEDGQLDVCFDALKDVRLVK